MKVFIGIPATRFVATDWWVSFINWIGDMGEKFEFKWMVDAKAGRVDWSRSNLIEAAKRWKPDWFIQLDTDIIPETDFQAVIGLLNKDRALGFDCIVSPTASVAGVVLAKPLNPPKEGENLPYDEPWEIDWAGGGFVAMSANALKKIAQIGSFASVGVLSGSFVGALSNNSFGLQSLTPPSCTVMYPLNPCPDSGIHTMNTYLGKALMRAT